MYTSTIEFNKKLMEMLCKNELENIEKMCLISKMPLENNYIKLHCNHTFNYLPLINEISNQKNKSHNYLEVQKLGNKQIKCPYCRRIQEGLLPWRSPHDKIWNVNWPPTQQYLPNNCIYIFISGKRSNQVCGKKCLNQYCVKHKKIIENRKYKLCKKYSKKLMKPLIKSVLTNKINQKTCTYIFRKGKYKGNLCKCRKIYKQTSQLCKTHYKYYIKHNKDKNIISYDTSLNEIYKKTDSKDVQKILTNQVISNTSHLIPNINLPISQFNSLSLNYLPNTGQSYFSFYNFV